MASNPVAPRIDPATATIANGASLSGAVDLSGRVIAGILMPAAWTTANLSLQASLDGTTYADVYNDTGDEVVIEAAASVFIAVSPAVFSGMRFVKIRSGLPGAAVNQGGARTLVLALREID